ncbi:MAG TPA: heparinase II/III family protein, partial [Sphingomonadaceae bacterium]|nr:heparinase II/III family protein [Sphingomonadaceae bacterium]
MNALIRAGLIARTSARLGLRNVAAVALHRVKTRVRRDTRVSELPPGPLFRPRTCAAEPHVADAHAVLRRAERIGDGELQIFGDHWVRLGFPFRWRENVLPQSANGYDIKGVWEASRFGWAVDLARAHQAAPGAGHLARLEANIESWIAEHPPFRGDNWSCGQEASIRVLHLLLAHQVLSGETALTPRLAALVARHLGRIERTLSYAVAQQNNHATSEAAALFVGGAVLAGHMDTSGAPRRWEELGRRTLEHTVAGLVMPDGGFAQYSTNYHRLMLDTLCQVELWRSRLGRPPFSERYRERCRAATRWLGAVTNAATGAAPNLGHNDGAQAYRLTDAPYADHRPSVALAARLFEGAAPAADNSLPLAEKIYDKTSRVFPDFGLALINPDPAGGGSYAFVRFPVRRFRPAQADMLHFDLWTADGENL